MADDHSARGRIPEESFTYLTRTLSILDIVYLAVILPLSSAPWVSGALLITGTVVGVLTVKLTARDVRYHKPFLVVLMLIGLALCVVSGVDAPAWLFLISTSLGVIFIIPERVYRLLFLAGIVAVATVGNTLAGKDLIATVTASVSLACFGFLMLQSFLFLKRATDKLAAQKLELEIEQAEVERLLLNVLPRSVAARLRSGQRTIAESFPEATILFADIVGFSRRSEGVPPEHLVEFLNQFFSRFDALTERYALEKIKTIGDAYMVVAGVPIAQADHAERAARMALDMLAEVEEFNAGHPSPVELRVGLHSGPVVAGVIGTKKFSYDVWGDAVNVASRMESHGVPGRVQVSEGTARRIASAFRCSERGVIEIKGKGPMRTFLLDATRRAR